MMSPARDMDNQEANSLLPPPAHGTQTERDNLHAGFDESYHTLDDLDQIFRNAPSTTNKPKRKSRLLNEVSSSGFESATQIEIGLRASSRLSGSDRLRYDLKYHPMDEVTRPAAAKRRKASLGIEEDVELEDSWDEQEDDTDEEEEDGSERVLRMTRGKRHSKRLNRADPLNYSTRVHPQDKALREAGVSLSGLNAARPKKRIIISDDSHDDTVDEDDEASQTDAKASTSTATWGKETVDQPKISEKPRTKRNGTAARVAKSKSKAFDIYAESYIKAWEDLPHAPLSFDEASEVRTRSYTQAYQEARVLRETNLSEQNISELAERHALFLFAFGYRANFRNDSTRSPTDANGDDDAEENGSSEQDSSDVGPDTNGRAVVNDENVSPF